MCLEKDRKPKLCPQQSKTIPENITKDIQDIKVMVMILMAQQWPGNTTDQFHPVAIWQWLLFRDLVNSPDVFAANSFGNSFIRPAAHFEWSVGQKFAFHLVAIFS